MGLKGIPYILRFGKYILVPTTYKVIINCSRKEILFYFI